MTIPPPPHTHTHIDKKNEKKRNLKKKIISSEVNLRFDFKMFENYVNITFFLAFILLRFALISLNFHYNDKILDRNRKLGFSFFLKNKYI